MDDRAARRARHLRQCERLADIALELTEAARLEALKEFQPPAPRHTYAMPGMPTFTLPDPYPVGRSTTFNDLVMQLSRCAPQAILLEARLDSGICDRPPSEPRAAATEPAAARRPATTRDTQRNTSDHMRIAHERLEDDLAVDANRATPNILAGIPDELAAIVESRLFPHRARPAPAKPPATAAKPAIRPHHPPATAQPSRPPAPSPHGLPKTARPPARSSAPPCNPVARRIVPPAPIPACKGVAWPASGTPTPASPKPAAA